MRANDLAAPPNGTPPEVPVDSERWGFSKEYRSYDKRSWRSDGKGYLQASCLVTVFDYGRLGETFCCQVNGVDIVGRGKCKSLIDTARVSARSVKELLDNFPPNFFQKPPAWGKVRWINIEGRCGEVIQFCLYLMKCERHYAFNTLVDLTQRPMGLMMDSDEDDTNFMLVTQVADLTARALELRANESDSLYQMPPKCTSQEVVDYEQVSYLLHVPSDGKFGMLVSIQQGKEGDTYAQVRNDITSRQAIYYERGIQHLFVKLVDSSTQRLWGIQHFIGGGLDQLAADMELKPGSHWLFLCAQSIDMQCNSIVRALEPLESTLNLFLAKSQFDCLIGKAKPSWSAVAAQQKRFLENINTLSARAKAIANVYKDTKQKQEEERHLRIEKSQNIVSVMLSLFSPLSFISGIYGMNFTKPDGSPGMPELSYGYALEDPADPGSAMLVTHPTGYEYFWILCSSIVICTILLYMCLGLIRGPWALFSSIKKAFKVEARKVVGFKAFEDATEDDEDELAESGLRLHSSLEKE